MRKLWLSERMIAKSFWNELFCSIYRDEALSDSKISAKVTGPLVKDFPTIAGSISIDSGMYLWLLMKYFTPKYVCEIGTYIGRSTLSIAFGGSETIQKIYTCDGTYDCMNFKDFDLSLIDVRKVNAINTIEYFGKTMSTDLLRKLHNDGVTVDLVFIDGRIGADDCSLLTQVCSDDCVFVLDDFDGVEKGVVNAVMLRGVFKSHILLEPPFLDKKGVPLNLAVLVPSKILTLTRQQTLPVDM